MRLNLKADAIDAKGIASRVRLGKARLVEGQTALLI